jgi:hypothetical protein
MRGQLGRYPYARVWEAVAWQFPPGKHLAPAAPADTERRQRLARRIVDMLLALPTATLCGGLERNNALAVGLGIRAG